MHKCDSAGVLRCGNAEVQECSAGVLKCRNVQKARRVKEVKECTRGGV